MSNSNGFQGMKLGHLSSLLSDYMYDKVIAEEFSRYPKQAIVKFRTRRRTYWSRALTFWTPYIFIQFIGI